MTVPAERTTGAPCAKRIGLLLVYAVASDVTVGVNRPGAAGSRTGTKGYGAPVKESS
jgi:hypothetical protein